MTRECHVRFCERLRVKPPRPTYQSAGDLILRIGHTGDFLIDDPHIPADAGQSFPPQIDKHIELLSFMRFEGFVIEEF